MEIVKSLNLNKNYKDVQNASIVCAKNIMTDDTGSYITTEPGFRAAFTAPSGYTIVGVVEAINEIVIFLYKSSSQTDSKIYRLKDNGTSVEVITKWSYKPNTTLLGSYTYNRDGNLIIALSSYDNANAKYPLEIINLDADTTVNTNLLKQEPDIPEITDITETIEQNGTLVCGTYTFFIRYKISKTTFTKWFPLTGDIHIIDSVWKEAPKHTYQLNGNKIVLSNNSLDYIVVNKNKQSNQNIVITFNVSNTLGYNEYQIGYIIKRQTSILGRLKGTYYLSSGNNTFKMYNNSFDEEISTDNFLESPHQFYNVKALTSYNNRLYVANYKEYDILSSKSSISISLGSSETIPSGTFDVTENHAVREIATFSTAIVGTFSQATIDNVEYIDSGSVKNISSPYNWFTYNIIDNTKIKFQGNEYTLRAFENNDSPITDSENHRILGALVFIVEDGKIPSTAHCLYSCPAFGTRTDSEHIKYTYRLQNSNDNLIVTFTDDDKEFNLNENKIAIVLVAENAGAGNTTGYYITGVYQAGALTTFLGRNLSDNAQFTFNINFSQQITNFASQTIPNVEIGNQTFNNINSRSLIHKQRYEIFIHYIKSDGSYTPGLYVDTFVSTDSSNSPKYRYLKINSVTIPFGYVGYFLTYRNIIQNVQTFVRINNENKAFYSSANYIYKGDTPKNIGNYKIEDNLLREPALYGNDNDSNDLLYLTYTSENIVSGNKKDPLYRLTPNYYTEATNIIVPFYYYPGYINSEKFFHFTPKCLISPSSNSVISEYGLPISYDIIYSPTKNYSNIPIDAYSVKQDYIEGAVQLVDGQGNSLGVYYNKVLTPAMIRDFLEIDPAYTALPDKSYIIYSDEYTDKFPTTIYRSDVISDESLYNGFRHFEPNNYKNVFENKGEIINLVPLGLYFVIHTKYGIFVIDRNSAINRRVQLDIPDVFDVSYKELLPGGNGLGGITKREHSIITTEGYFWFDSLNKLIFQFSNGQIGVLSKEINDFIKILDIVDCRFAEDIDNHRLLICLSHKYTTNQETHYSYITLSYSFITKSFISLHDYVFTHNYKTSAKSYFFNGNSSATNNVLYVFDENEHNYKNLFTTSTGYFADQYYNNNNKLAYVDIIINASYELPKVVNSIGYVMNKLNNIAEKIFTSALLENNVNGSDYEYVNKYSGYKLQIFNDQTNTGELDISAGTPHNPNPYPDNTLREPYTKPYYDKGRWNFNYFRNITTKRELSGTDYTSVQDNSLIYGKYFIIRFLFDMAGIKPKLEAIDVNLNNY